MTKLEIKSKEPFVILPLKEYEYLKSIVRKIGAKIESNENSNFLTPAQIKHFNEIEEKILKGNWTDFLDYEDFKKEVMHRRRENVSNQNRKKSRKVYS